MLLKNTTNPELSDDNWHLIFQFLRADELAGVAPVCRRFQEIAYHKNLWEHHLRVLFGKTTISAKQKPSYSHQAHQQHLPGGPQPQQPRTTTTTTAPFHQSSQKSSSTLAASSAAVDIDVEQLPPASAYQQNGSDAGGQRIASAGPGVDQSASAGTTNPSTGSVVPDQEQREATGGAVLNSGTASTFTSEQPHQEGQQLSAREQIASIIASDFFLAWKQGHTEHLPKTAPCVFSHIVKSWYFFSRCTGRCTLVVEAPQPDSDGLAHAAVRYLCHPFLQENRLMRVVLDENRRNALFVFREVPFLLSHFLKGASPPAAAGAGSSATSSGVRCEGEIPWFATLLWYARINRNMGQLNRRDHVDHKNALLERQNVSFDMAYGSMQEESQEQSESALEPLPDTGTLPRGDMIRAETHLVFEERDPLPLDPQQAVLEHDVELLVPARFDLPTGDHSCDDGGGAQLEQGQEPAFGNSSSKTTTRTCFSSASGSSSSSSASCNTSKSSTLSTASAGAAALEQPARTVINHQENDNHHRVGGGEVEDLLPLFPVIKRLGSERGSHGSGDTPAAWRSPHDHHPSIVPDDRIQLPGTSNWCSSNPSSSSASASTSTISCSSSTANSKTANVISSSTTSKNPLLKNSTFSSSSGITSGQHQFGSTAATSRSTSSASTSSTSTSRGRPTSQERADERVLEEGVVTGYFFEEEHDPRITTSAPHDHVTASQVGVAKGSNDSALAIKRIMRDILLLLRRLHATGNGHGNLDASKVVLDSESGRPIELLDFFFGSGINPKSTARLAHDRESLGISYVKKPPEALLAQLQPPGGLPLQTRLFYQVEDPTGSGTTTTSAIPPPSNVVPVHPGPGKNPVFDSDLWQLGLLLGTLCARKIGCSWVTQWLPPNLASLVLDSELSWIYQLFGLLGTPTDWVALAGRDFPKWRPCGLFTGRYTTSEQRSFVKNLGGQLGVSFLRGLLRMDPDRRFTIAEALAHPYFDEIRVPVQVPRGVEQGPDQGVLEQQEMEQVVSSIFSDNRHVVSSAPTTATTITASPVSFGAGPSVSSASTSAAGASSTLNRQEKRSPAALRPWNADYFLRKKAGGSSTAGGQRLLQQQSSQRGKASSRHQRFLDSVNTQSFWAPHPRLRRFPGFFQSSSPDDVGQLVNNSCDDEYAYLRTLEEYCQDVAPIAEACHKDDEMKVVASPDTISAPATSSTSSAAASSSSTTSSSSASSSFVLPPTTPNKIPRLPAPVICGNQLDITVEMRSVLVDWLVEVHHKFRFDFPSTLFLTINILDRFLQFHVLNSRKRFQLVGLACLLLSSKVEETRPAIVEELSFICEHTYTEEEIRGMEFCVVKTLLDNGHVLRVPTAYTFLARDPRYYVCRFVPQLVPVWRGSMCLDPVVSMDSLGMRNACVPCAAPVPPRGPDTSQKMSEDVEDDEGAAAAAGGRGADVESSSCFGFGTFGSLSMGAGREQRDESGEGGGSGGGGFVPSARPSGSAGGDPTSTTRTTDVKSSTRTTDVKSSPVFIRSLTNAYASELLAINRGRNNNTTYNVDVGINIKDAERYNVGKDAPPHGYQAFLFELDRSYVADFILELSLLDASLSGLFPSSLAEAAMDCAEIILVQWVLCFAVNESPEEIQHYSDANTILRQKFTCPSSTSGKGSRVDLDDTNNMKMNNNTRATSSSSTTTSSTRSGNDSTATSSSTSASMMNNNTAQQLKAKRDLVKQLYSLAFEAPRKFVPRNREGQPMRQATEMHAVHKKYAHERFQGIFARVFASHHYVVGAGETAVAGPAHQQQPTRTGDPRTTSTEVDQQQHRPPQIGNTFGPPNYMQHVGVAVADSVDGQGEEEDLEDEFFRDREALQHRGGQAVGGGQGVVVDQRVLGGDVEEGGGAELHITEVGGRGHGGPLHGQGHVHVPLPTTGRGGMVLGSQQDQEIQEDPSFPTPTPDHGEDGAHSHDDQEHLQGETSSLPSVAVVAPLDASSAGSAGETTAVRPGTSVSTAAIMGTTGALPTGTTGTTSTVCSVRDIFCFDGLRNKGDDDSK
ncbi:unnamed protein product [Amoebophrya sp. A25]|nr:unnamed protein product [Amoebophrya sp. A25]|eukprot:GSA25T00006631001.1